jgi:hypothetical protein
MTVGRFKLSRVKLPRTHKIVSCLVGFLEFELTSRAIVNVRYRLSDRAVMEGMHRELYLLVLQHLQVRLPPDAVRSHRVLGPGVPVPAKALFFDWIVIAQRRYHASSRSRDRANSMVAIKTSFNDFTVGELQVIFAFNLPLPQQPVVRLGAVRMLRPVAEAYPMESAWSKTYAYPAFTACQC